MLCAEREAMLIKQADNARNQRIKLRELYEHWDAGRLCRSCVGLDGHTSYERVGERSRGCAHGDHGQRASQGRAAGVPSRPLPGFVAGSG